MISKIFLPALIIIPFLTFSQVEVSLNKKGVKHSKNRNYDKAKTYFEKAINENPNYGPSYANIGLIYKIKGELKLAISTLDKSLKLDSTSNEAYLAFMYRGQCYLDLEEYTLAIKDLEKSIALNVQNNTLRFEIGYANAMLRNYPEVKRNFDIYVKHYPNAKMAKINLANVERLLGNVDYSLKEHIKLIKEYPNEYLLHNNIAEVYLDLKEYQLALTNVNKAIALKDKYAIGHFVKSKVYLAMDDIVNACTNYKLSLEYGVTLDIEPEKEILELNCK